MSTKRRQEPNATATRNRDQNGPPHSIPCQSSTQDLQLIQKANDLEGDAAQPDQVETISPPENGKSSPKIEPYLLKVLVEVEHHADRIAATLEQLNRSITVIGQKSGPMGRLLRNLGCTIGGGVLGAVTASVMAEGFAETWVLCRAVGTLVGIGVRALIETRAGRRHDRDLAVQSSAVTRHTPDSGWLICR